MDAFKAMSKSAHKRVLVVMSAYEEAFVGLRALTNPSVPT